MNDFENISNISEEDNNCFLNNRYKLRNKIGEGSYGVVYRAFDTKNKNNLVAIKQVSKTRINNNVYLIEALKKELSIMRLISDENSVELIEDFETKEYYNFVMELCDSDLDVELKKHFKKNDKGFNELEVQEIMLQFNKIFKKMQKKHVIHRDLKLKNIMIKYDETKPFIKFIIKLSDFGFSKIMNEDDVTGTNLGSPATKAPEIMLGKDYNAKADLWSVGVIMYQLFYNILPFPARNPRELKEVILSSKGVQLPKDNNNKMSEICFNLINRLLQKNPEKRIGFKEYFEHEFFSEKHKKNLIEGISKIKDENILKNQNKENLNWNNDNDSMNDNKNNEKEKKNNMNENIDFDKRFIKILKIKEYLTGCNIYKAKDTLKDKIVLIKEISRSIIDNNDRNKKIFNKEIYLLSSLEGKQFPHYIGTFIAHGNYNIIIEYFSGNNLYTFIKRRPLEESLVCLILKQLKPAFEELNKKNIILEFISPKNFAFKFYQNKTNFEIKFFDYGLNSIFFDEKYIKYYLLEEAELGKVNNSSINILSFGLTIYKMLFREEALIKKNEDYEVIMKGTINSEYKENLKYLLSRCIKKEKRYNWEELLLYDNFINKMIDQKNNNNYEKNKECIIIIEDENIEKIFEIIIKKFNFIIDYFVKKFDEKDHFIDNDLYDYFYDDVITFLYFCILECKTIIQFIKTYADQTNSNIDEAEQEIHLLKIYLNKNSKDEIEYDYSFINFKNENNNLYLYNKENPTFEFYLSKFSKIKMNIFTIYSKLRGNNKINNSSNEIEKSNSSIDVFESACSSILNNSQESDLNCDNIELKNEKDGKNLKVGNLDKLFYKCFENGALSYSINEKEKAIEELNFAKYLLEYIIFLKIVLGDKNKTLNFEKINLNDENNCNNMTIDYKNQYSIFATFIGRKIKLCQGKKILGDKYTGSNDNLAEYNDPKIENIKIYNRIISFYPRIIQFISEIKKEQN